MSEDKTLYRFNATIGVFMKSKPIVILSLRILLLTVISLYAFSFWPVQRVQANTTERVVVYLSDLSQCNPPLSLAKRLIDAKRLSMSLHDVLYHCDRSIDEDLADTNFKLIKSYPISIQGKIYEKGIGTATPFVMTYDLGGKFSFFSTIVGVDDAEERRANDTNDIFEYETKAIYGDDYKKKRAENWIFDVYLDGGKAGSWLVPKNGAVEVKVDTTGAQELVLVGKGRDEMMVNLAGAYLLPTSERITPGRANTTNRKAMFELDDNLVRQCEVLLLSRAAKKIDSETGPDDTAQGHGGYGRMSTTRGADIWTGIKDKGDLLRWEALIRRPGKYKIWVRAVSAEPGKTLKPEDYIVRVDGKILPYRLAPHLIMEYMPGGKFTGHFWGYLFSDIRLDTGLHTVEVENAGGSFLAVNRAVLVHQGRTAQSLRLQKPLKPISASHEITINPRLEPKKLFGQEFIVGAMDDEMFGRASQLGLMFAPDYLSFVPRATDEFIQKAMTSDGLFTMWARFNREFEKPVIDEETYRKMKEAAGERWQGFNCAEWTGCYRHFAPESRNMPNPKTRKEAYDRMKTWYQRIAAAHYNYIIPYAGSRLWDHYTGEWGEGPAFQSEPGISPESHFRSLFSRGAARQYGKYWAVQIANGAHDYRSFQRSGYMVRNHPHDTCNNTEGGSSMSWIKRVMYQSYMWGATSFVKEVEAYKTNVTADGEVALSPMGELAGEFFEFAATHKDRGTSYTPVGIMFDYLHGWGGHPIYPRGYPPLTWGYLQPEPSDYMKDTLFGMLYPGQAHILNEWNLLSPTPFGDLFDVMLSSAELEHIQAYPVLILVGDVAADMNDTLASNLETYVRSGGTLVINTKQIALPFPEDLLGVKITDKTNQADLAKCNLDNREIKGQTFSYHIIELTSAKSIISTSDNKPLVTRNEVGKGVVILTTVPYLLQDNFNGVCFLPHLMEHLTSGLLPFHVYGDIEYTANRNEDSWLVTLINNRGVYKVPTEPAIIDPMQRQTAYITMDKNPSELTDWITGDSLSAEKMDNKWQISIHIPPGDLIIVQIKD